MKTTASFILLLGFLINSPGLAYSQGCGCQDKVNVQLNGDCQFVLKLSNVQAGTCPDSYKVIVNDNNPNNGNIIDCPGKWTYGIFDSKDNLICWGEVLAEDKTGPKVKDIVNTHKTLECSLFNFVHNNETTTNPNSKYYLGQVLFEDNCASCGCFVNVKFYDETEFFDCPSDKRTARIRRRWTATDCEGNSTDAYQTFDFVQPNLNELKPAKDITIQTCNPAGATLKASWPYWIDVFGDTLWLNEIDCKYSATVRESKFTSCPDGSYKLERYIDVFDWCAGYSKEIDHYIVKVGDFKGPIFKGNAKPIEGSPFNTLATKYDKSDFIELDKKGMVPTISTGSSDCTAAFFIDRNSLESRFGFTIDECSNTDINITVYTYGPKIVYGIPTGPAIWQQTNYPMLPNMATGVPVGLHALVIEAKDKCYNAATGVVLFKVKDQTAPVMKCDDELTVSVTTGSTKFPAIDAYARVDARDVDEGSWDNCELGKMLVRRSVADLEACEAAFIASGYDGDRDGTIDKDDWFDENGNGIFDEGHEYKWERKDGVWYTPWREFTEFFCCDVDKSITIELRGWDKAKDPLTGMEMPNYNTCWLNIVIEDSSTPVLTELQDKKINCDDDILQYLKDGTYTDANNASLLSKIRSYFGSVGVSGTSCGSQNVEETITTHLDNCRRGYITREVKITKTTQNKGTVVNSVKQRIDVILKHEYWICLPADVEANCTDGLHTVPGVTTSSNGCDLFAISHKDESFFSSGDGCSKVFRTYRIINWCEYDNITPAIKVARDWDGRNGTNPKRPDGDDQPGDEGICIIVDRDFNDNKPDTTWYDRDTDPHNNIPDHKNTDDDGYWWRVISGSNDPGSYKYYRGPVDNDGSGTITAGEVSTWGNDPNDNGSADDDDYAYGSNGFWEYTQHIVVKDKTPPVVSLTAVDTFCSNSNADCSGNVEMTLEISDDCSALGSITVSVALDVNNDGGSLVDVTSKFNNGVFRDRYPEGRHKLIFTVQDGCSNRATVSKVFDVVDCLAPTPICISGLSITLEAAEGTKKGAKEVWASDFIASVIGDCNGQGPNLVPVVNNVKQPIVTKYSINRVGAAAKMEDAGLEVTCEDAGKLVLVEVHAWDEAGNHGACETYVEVQDQSSLCTASGINPATIAGAIETEKGVKVEGAEVHLSGPLTMMHYTNAKGRYTFQQMEGGYDYSIEPRMNWGFQKGISVIDLIQVRKHILGVELLDSPYRMIAADVDNDQRISTIDLIQLQKLILNKITEVPGNSSWRFIAADYVFPDRKNPWSKKFPEVVNINNLRKDAMQTNFIAVKVGDTNGSAELIAAQGVEPRSSEEAMAIKTEDRELIAGNEYTFYLSAPLQDVNGYQFGLQVAPQFAEIVDVHHGLIQEEQLAIFKESGHIGSVWATQDRGLTGDAVRLFGLTIRAKVDASLSDILQLSTRFTAAEAYSFDSDLPRDIRLEIGSTVKEENAFVLLDNSPNPFHKETVISFSLPELTNITLTIRDLAGRTVKVIDAEFGAGQHQIQLSDADLPAAGVYQYTLVAGGFSDTKKMIHLE